MASKSQRQSATEISTLIESAYTRTRQRVRNFEWSVKRLLYLMLENMQQFYTEPRTFSLSEDNQVNYFTVGNTRATALNAMGMPNGQPPAPQEQPSPEDEQLTKDYERFIADYGEEDPIYAAFDLEVQTNSTLPMDKQSLSNLFLRLLEMTVGNPVLGMPMMKATLEILRVPKFKKIIAEMEQRFQQAQQPPGGAAPPAPPEGPESMMGQILRSQE